MRRSRLAAARAGHVRKRGQPCGRQRNVGSPRGPHLMVSTSMVYGCIIDVFNTENISAECFQGLARTAFYRHVAFRGSGVDGDLAASWAEELNGWVPLLGAQALLMMITLEIERPVGFGGCCAGNYIPVWRRIVGCGFRLGPVWETLGRNFALLWVALSATRLNRKACPSICARNGMEFPSSAC